MKTTILTAVLALSLFARGQGAPLKTPVQAEPFDLREVHLLDNPFKRAQDVTRRLLVETDINRLLYPFRREAGIPSPVKGPDDLNYAHTGHLLGHYLSACAQLYRNTADAEIKRKADAAVAALAECQANLGSGFIGGFPERTFNFKAKPNEPPVDAMVPWYCLHKVYAGLLDMYLLAENRQALDILKKAADWADERTRELTEAKMQSMLNAEHGGMNEVLANLYAATGEEKYLRLSLRFNHLSNVEPFARGEDPFDGAHANTRIPKFSGVARQHLLTGEPAQKAMAANFWNAVTTDRSYVTGGNSLHERFTPKGYLSHFVTGWTCESCNEYNMLKLTRYLFEMEPAASYADYYERTLFNHVLSSRHPETGGQLYFQLLQSGHSKGEPSAFSGWRFLFNDGPEAASNGSESSCCSGSGLESNTKYGDSIYFHHGEKELYVNLFIPSVLRWEAAGLTLRQETAYPEQGSARLNFTCEKPIALNVKIRRPWWATGRFEVRVNGKEQEIASAPGSYAQIERSWSNGDVVEVTMPMSFRLEGFKDNPKRAALMFGPLVMAGITDHGNPFSVIEDKDGRFLESIQPTTGKPLEFTGPPEVFRTSPLAVSDKPLRMRPLYATFDDSYIVYWDVVKTRDFEKMSADLQAELRRFKALDSQTVDLVLCEAQRAGPLAFGSMFSFQSFFFKDDKWLPRPLIDLGERAHGRKSGDSTTRSTGMEAYAQSFLSEFYFNFLGEFRSIGPGGSCSYELKVLPGKAQELQVRIWKAQCNAKDIPFKQGVMEILVNGEPVANSNVGALPAGQFSTVSCPLEPRFFNGKKTAEVMLRVPADSKPVFGISECRIIAK